MGALNQFFRSFLGDNISNPYQQGNRVNRSFPAADQGNFIPANGPQVASYRPLVAWDHGRVELHEKAV